MGFIPGIPSVSSRKNINIPIEVKIRHTSGDRTCTLRYRDGQLMTRKISLAVILVVDEEGDVHDRTHYNVNISIMVKICAINWWASPASRKSSWQVVIEFRDVELTDVEVCWPGIPDQIDLVFTCH